MSNYKADGTKNLIPYNTIPKSQHIQMSKNGGKAKTQAKKDAQKWRQIKIRAARQGLTSEDVDFIIDKVNNRDVQSFELLAKAELFYKDIHPAQRVALLNAELGIAKFIHGEKIKVESTNINVNLNRDLKDEELVMFDEFFARRKKT